MGMELISGRMEENTKGPIKTTRSMVQAGITGQMGGYSKALGSEGSVREAVLFS